MYRFRLMIVLMIVLMMYWRRWEGRRRGETGGKQQTPTLISPTCSCIRGHALTCNECRTSFIAKSTEHIFCSTSCASEALIRAARKFVIKDRKEDHLGFAKRLDYRFYPLELERGYSRTYVRTYLPTSVHPYVRTRINVRTYVPTYVSRLWPNGLGLTALAFCPATASSARLSQTTDPRLNV